MRDQTELVLPGRQIAIDGIVGWCYSPAHHRRPVCQGASSLKWEMSVEGPEEIRGGPQ